MKWRRVSPNFFLKRKLKYLNVQEKIWVVFRLMRKLEICVDFADGKRVRSWQISRNHITHKFTGI